LGHGRSFRRSFSPRTRLAFSKNTSRKCAQRSAPWRTASFHMVQEPRSCETHTTAISATGRSHARGFRPISSAPSLAPRPPAGLEWPCPRRATNRGVPRRVRSTRSCTITSRPFAPPCAAGKGCPASSSRSSGIFCSVAGSPAGSHGFAVATAASTGWSLFPVNAAPSVRVAAVAGWPNAPPTCSITWFPDVPVRQWVLSLPYRMRYQLCSDACARVRATTAFRTVVGAR
jgi:hypothetical protein